MGKSKKLSLPKKWSLLIPPEKVIDTTNRAFTVSFAQLDHKNQWATIDTIQDAKELSHMIEMFHGFKNEPVHKLVSSLWSDKFCIYGGFPPKDKTEFTHPKHVPHDAAATPGAKPTYHRT